MLIQTLKSHISFYVSSEDVCTLFNFFLKTAAFINAELCGEKPKVFL